MIAVEQLSKINQNNNDTFVTQRGGKIINDGTRKLGTMLFKTNEALFENNRTLQSTLLLQKKKEMHQVQQLLEKKRIEFAKRMEECREKQEELKVKQKQIRERVFKFEKFLKENDAKRQRANVKAQTEKKLREQKEQELLGLQKQLMEESKNSKNILTMLQKYKVFERYLQSAVDILPTDYLDVNEPHINDILMRHKTLVETNEDLMSMLQSFQDEIEKEQKGLQLSIKNKNDEILVYNSTLGFQQKKLDKMKQNCANLEQKQEEKDRTGKERMRILGEAKLAINNLYDRVSISRVRQPAMAVNNEQNSSNGTNASGGVLNANEKINNFVDKTSLTEKLNVIEQRVLDLSFIVKNNT